MNARRSDTEKRADEARQGTAQEQDVFPGADDVEHRATRFDGNPNPTADDGEGLFKPRDDTPILMEKRRGPRTGVVGQRGRGSANRRSDG